MPVWLPPVHAVASRGSARKLRAQAHRSGVRQRTYGLARRRPIPCSRDVRRSKLLLMTGDSNRTLIHRLAVLTAIVIVLACTVNAFVWATEAAKQ